jgi:xanthine/CO dehydrogenase XdhC/CoxF family maturation factor
MKEVLDDIERWRAAGHRVAIARVVGTEGSSPRDPGATMAVSDTVRWPDRCRAAASKVRLCRRP